MNITLIEWGNVKQAIVWKDSFKKEKFIDRLLCVAEVRELYTCPLSEVAALRDFPRLRDGWEQNATRLGTVFATGFSAITSWR